MMRITDDTCYLTDNGAVYCGKHLGATARMTGRDLSGQAIEPITPAVLREFDAMGCGERLKCEVPSCDTRPSRLTQ